jgi:branched-chain amino acid transport system permease protein
MSSGVQFYITTIAVYAGVDIMACWALNLQLGVAGVLNFSFIVFQAAGAYTAAILTLGPSSAYGGFQHYAGGARLPFPLPFLAAAAVGALLAIPIGFVALRRLRSDYQAVVMLVISVIATTVISNDVGLVNGSAGLSLIPQPLQGALHLSPVGYSWFYVGLTAIICVIVYFIVHRITASPFGRSLRAMRDNEQAIEALGRYVLRKRLIVMMIGGAIAALSGAVLVSFIGIWAPSAWNYPETLVFLAAVIIGGVGNNFGAVVGALIVPVAFAEGTRFLPQIGHPGLIEAIQWIAIGALIIGFLWFAPHGLIRERPHRFPRPEERERPAPATLVTKSDQTA